MSIPMPGCLPLLVQMPILMAAALWQSISEFLLAEEGSAMAAAELIMTHTSSCRFSALYFASTYLSSMSQIGDQMQSENHEFRYYTDDDLADGDPFITSGLSLY